jgi:lipid-A-disaccharide synthase
VVLPNLILGENVFPELLNRECDGERLSKALLPLMRGGPERDEQLAGVGSVLECVRETDEAPSVKAARIVLAYAEQDSAALAPFQRSSMGT